MSPEEIREADLPEALKWIGWKWSHSELPTGFPMREVDEAFRKARAYADLLENGATADTQIVQTTNGPLRVLLPGGPSGRYLVVPVEGER